MRGRVRFRFGRRVLSVFFPDRCAVCGKVVRPEEGICPDCRAAIPRVGIPVCPFCGAEKEYCICRKRRRHYESVAAPWYYDGGAASAILRMKASGDPVAAVTFAREMADTAEQYYGDIAFDGVVFVPSFGTTERRRGYNPGRMIAEELAALLGLPVLPALEKVIETKPQKGLTAVERSGNVLGTFDLKEGADVAGKTLLLADDILTTGSTADECAKMLKIYGAEAVYVVACAITRPEKEKKTEE